MYSEDNQSWFGKMSPKKTLSSRQVHFSDYVDLDLGSCIYVCMDGIAPISFLHTLKYILFNVRLLLPSDSRVLCAWGSLSSSESFFS